MSEKYIHQNRNSFSVVFKSHNYGTFKNLENAILIDMNIKMGLEIISNVENLLIYIC